MNILSKRLDLRKSKVMIWSGAAAGGWVKSRDLSRKVATILKVNRESLAVAMRTGERVSVFSIVTRRPFEVIPVPAAKAGS